MAAVIGQAWRTPLGASIDEAMARLLAGERAAIASPRAAGFACTVVAPITGEPAKSRQSRFLRRMGLFGLEVAHEAVRAAKSGASESPALAAALADGKRIGLFAGVGGLRAHWDDMMAALEHQSESGENAWERGLRDVHPYWMLRHLSNNVHALAAMELGIRGEGATYGGATGGAQAVAAATRALAAGALDAALVVAYDSLLEPETLVELGARRAATLETDPSRVAPPYDAGSAGFVPGEAAGALVLVRPDAAPASPRLIVADAGDGERDQPAPATLARTLTRALGPSLDGAIAMIDGAARGWPDRDLAERSLLAEQVGGETPLVALTASLGQLGAATTVIQAIALAELLRRAVLPPILGFTSPSTGNNPSISTHASTTARSMGALGVSTGAPGLCAVVRVELPRTAP